MNDPVSVAETRVAAGLLDTSVVIAMDELGEGELPDEIYVSAITFAELAAGPHAVDDESSRAQRQDRLQWAESEVHPLPFDAAAARAYGRVYAATRAARRKPRGARAIDLLIASVALANGLPLFTRNPEDFEHLRDIGLDVRIV